MLSAAENQTLTRTGSTTPMGVVFRKYWQPVLLSRELESDGAPKRLRLLGEDFVAFLKTLTDEVLLTTERLSDPFVARAGSKPVGDAARLGSAEAVDENSGIGPGIYVAVLAAVLGLFTVVNLLSGRKAGDAGSD